MISNTMEVEMGAQDDEEVMSDTFDRVDEDSEETVPRPPNLVTKMTMTLQKIVKKQIQKRNYNLKMMMK